MRKDKIPINLYQHEQKSWNNSQLVCGIDEVGRGCLAGPIVTTAVILNKNSFHPEIADSKTLSSQKMTRVYKWLIENSTYCIGINSPRVIDRYNIYQTTAITMKQAIFHLFSKTITLPSLILIDAMPLSLKNTPYDKIPLESFIKGESKSVSIAAASIIAKVTRDKILEQLHPSFPQYQLQKHKGYATQIHRSALQTFQPSVIHRKTFLKNLTKGLEHEQQKKLFC